MAKCQKEGITIMIRMFQLNNEADVVERKIESVFKKNQEYSITYYKNAKWILALVKEVLILQCTTALDGYKSVQGALVEPSRCVKKAKEKSELYLKLTRIEIQNYLHAQYEKSSDHTLSLNEWFQVYSVIMELLNEQEKNILEEYTTFLDEYIPCSRYTVSHLNDPFSTIVI